MLRLLLTATALLLPASTAHAQTEQEVMDGIDVVWYCATAFAVSSGASGVPEEKAAYFNEASTALFDLGITTLADGGMDEAAIDGVAAAYLEEISASIQAGEDLRFSEEACIAAYDAFLED